MIRSIIRRAHTRAQTIFINKGETCFVVYHPERQYPYEHTKPMTKLESLDQQSPLEANDKHMIVKSPNLEQLQALTYTHARFWYQYVGKEKRQKYIDYFNDNEDRKGLTS